MTDKPRLSTPAADERADNSAAHGSQKRKLEIEREKRYQAKRLARPWTLGRTLYEQLNLHNPRIRARPGYRQMVRYLLHDRNFEDAQGLLLPAAKIAVFEGEQACKQYINGRYRASHFLWEFERDVLPGFAWRGWSYDRDTGKGRCRGVEPESIAHLVAAARQDFAETERYEVLTGRKWNEKNRREQNVQMCKQAEQIAWPYEEQRPIAAYLHALPLRIFEKQVLPRVQDAYRAIVQDRSLSQEEQGRRLGPLQAIRDLPKPFYRPGESGQDARLFAHRSLCDVKRALRRLLCEGWYEVDLKAAHLAIAAAIFPIAPLQDALRHGADPWRLIAEELGLIDLVEQQGEALRDALKQALYRPLNGGTLEESQQELRTVCAQHGIRDMRPLHASPLVAALMQAVKKQRQEVQARGYTDTPLGRVDLRGTDKDSINSHLSYTFHAYELALIAPCFEIAQQSTDFLIVLHQHDGFSVQLRQEDRARQVLNRLNRAVAAVAGKYEIITRLEYKTLPPAYQEQHLCA